MSTISYKPLNLYRQFKTAAQEFPTVAIYFDHPYASFPELGLENTYQTVFEAIQRRAAQFAAAGIGYGDKVILYKSPAFDTYLLAVAVMALGAVPVMISYHLPSSNLDVFAERLEKS
ncbi:TPA: AMP-binding protein, partial [Streptococcus suis]|nr:AMP-binding protein [Streptococcus suis]